jgi:parallel beta-helix repeat protein
MKVTIPRLVTLTFTVAGFLALSGSPASASHLSCGDEITADTTLDSDLLDCPNNGIVIGADDITLDLNGHRIDGDDELVNNCPVGEFCDIGLLNDGHDGVIVRDGSVREFAFGVLLVSARHNRVVDITVSRSDGTGIILFRASRNRVIRNTARANGFQFDQGGIALNRSHHNLVKRNVMRHNDDLGLFMEASDENRIAHNRSRGHREGGMIIEGDRNAITRNRMVREGGGILIAIVTRDGRAVGNVIRRNVVRNARAGGIAVEPGPKRTTLRRNRVVGSGRGGILIGGRATKLIANRAVRNDGDGIDVRSRSTKLTRNRAVRNGDLGIEAVRGVTDGGGNKAHGNGDPRQCTNVACK